MTICNTNTTQCASSSIYAGYANEACGSFFNPGDMMGEQLVYNNAFMELINNFGLTCMYYVHSYNVENGADNLYGEHPLAQFSYGVPIKAYLQLNENALTLSKFGYASDDDLTAYIAIDTFTNTFAQHNLHVPYGQRIEPKSGDIIEITALGCDRPGDRGPKLFEVTERVDQDIGEINPLLGHYVWRLRAKRFEHSFEPGAPRERGDEQVYEDTFAGKLSTNVILMSSINIATDTDDIIITDTDSTLTSITMTPELSSESKSYTWDIDNDSETNVFDQTINNTDIYGLYD